MTIFLCLAAILVFSTDAQIFPSVLTRIGGTPVQQGVLLSSLYLLFPFTSVLAGRVADRMGKRLVLAFGAAAAGAPFVVAALAADLRVWTVAFLLFGLGSAILEGQSSALLSDVSPGRERAAINLSQAFYCLGASGGPLAISAAYRSIPGLRVSTLLWCAGAASGALAVGFLLLRGKEARAPAATPAGLRKLWANRRWRLLCISLFLYVAAETGTASWLAKYGHEVLGMLESQAPLCISLFWGGLGASRAILGLGRVVLGDRTILFAGNAAALVCHVLAFSLRSPAAALPLVALLGFALGCIWPTLVALAGSSFRGSSGMAVGAMVASGGLAVPIIQPVIGVLSRPELLGLQGALLSLGLLLAANLPVLAAVFRAEPARRPPLG